MVFISFIYSIRLDVVFVGLQIVFIVGCEHQCSAKNIFQGVFPHNSKNEMNAINYHSNRSETKGHDVIFIDL